jgi:hypothetical protein
MRGIGKRAISAAIVAGAFAAGCGGGSGAVTAPNTPKQLAADKATANQAVLTSNDLPAGYTGVPHDESSSIDVPPAVDKKFAACSGLPKRFLDTSKDDQPNSDSPDFSKGRIGQGAATEIDSSVELDRSSKDISEPLSHLSTAAKCFEPVFRALFAGGNATPGVRFTDLSVSSLEVDSVGDQSAAFQGSITVSGSARSIVVSFDLYFVRTGRAIVTMTTLGYDTEVSRALAKSLLQTMVDRLKAAT